MLLYHGTSARVARAALTEGLKPRVLTGKGSNWKRTVESNPTHVYLTCAYPLFFAFNATRDLPPSVPIGVVEVDTDLLDQRLMLPDEDFLEQASRDLPRRLRGPWWYDLAHDEAGDDMVLRTQCFRDNLHLFKSAWRESVEHLSTAAYDGLIPPSAITRIAVLSPAKMKGGPGAGILLLSLDAPGVGLDPYRYVGAKYRALTRLVFDPDEVDVSDFTFGIPVPGMTERYEEMRVDRRGIEVLDGPGALSCAGEAMMGLEPEPTP